ncbi:uncharacterized protein LOC119547623 [Drosophila subpulchrella]|uniref:uncharacterized protein LOC119547623 n=1 Tax=Drosophila subpulchrella TaxID=1486046 RepID=UPI0018A139CF|nr:uncharacterized protein LOC119547623 [Drosophila subpulchrella]
MYCLISLLLVMHFIVVSAKVTSSPPVLIWGTDTPKATSIFRPLKSGQFQKIIQNLRKDNMIVVYLASELAAKDINCDVCFPYLSKIQPMNYYSQVEEPLKAVERVSKRTGEIIWHYPALNEIRKLELEMELPCKKGQIHAFSFNNRNVLAHDAAMAVATYQFSDCPVVHVYTAYTEEDRAFQRRKIHKTRPAAHLMDPLKSLDASSNTSDYEFGQMPQRFSYSLVDNMTVLRHDMLILSFRNILLAKREVPGLLNPFNRTDVVLPNGREEVQVAFLNGRDVHGGIIVGMDTNISPLLLEFIPSQGNWFLTRMILSNSSHYLRDYLFFGFEFSLCCTDITGFASDTERLTFFDFHLDILWRDTDNGMDLNYEVKPCWSCSVLMTPTLTQTLFVGLIIVILLWIGLAMILSIGQNKILQNANDPDLHIKTDT